MKKILRIDVIQKMFFMLVFLILVLSPLSFAESDPKEAEDTLHCNPECGCKGCLAHYEKFMKSVVYTYDKSNDDFLSKEGMAKTIYIEGEKIFSGIMISVILFISCTGICVVSACIYCCRMNYTDLTLKRNVKAVAKRVNKDFSSKKMVSKRAPLPAVSESCNVVVEDAGVFVV